MRCLDLLQAPGRRKYGAGCAAFEVAASARGTNGGKSSMLPVKPRLRWASLSLLSARNVSTWDRGVEFPTCTATTAAGACAECR